MCLAKLREGFSRQGLNRFCILFRRIAASVVRVFQFVVRRAHQQHCRGIGVGDADPPGVCANFSALGSDNQTRLELHAFARESFTSTCPLSTNSLPAAVMT